MQNRNKKIKLNSLLHKSLKIETNTIGNLPERKHTERDNRSYLLAG